MSICQSFYYSFFFFCFFWPGIPVSQKPPSSRATEDAAGSPPAPVQVHALHFRSVTGDLKWGFLFLYRISFVWLLSSLLSLLDTLHLWWPSSFALPWHLCSFLSVLRMGLVLRKSFEGPPNSRRLPVCCWGSRAMLPGQCQVSHVGIWQWFTSHMKKGKKTGETNLNKIFNLITATYPKIAVTAVRVWAEPWAQAHAGSDRPSSWRAATVSQRPCSTNPRFPFPALGQATPLRRNLNAGQRQSPWKRSLSS